MVNHVLGMQIGMCFSNQNLPIFKSKIGKEKHLCQSSCQTTMSNWKRKACHGICCCRKKKVDLTSIQLCPSNK